MAKKKYKIVQNIEEESILEEFKSVAMVKELEVPDDSGYVHHVFEGSFKSMEDQTLEDLYPDNRELALIKGLGGLLPPTREQYIIIRKARPIGDRTETDWQGDKISAEAEQDLMNQGYNTPVLQDHKHTIEDRPPVGMCIESGVDDRGLWETYAIPLTSYNEDMVQALKLGQVNKISIGTLIRPENKVCNSCLKRSSKEKSIYSRACNHKPLMKDENGEYCSYTVKKIDRYLERSFVNVPARMGTSLKSLDVDKINSTDNLDLKKVDGDILEELNMTKEELVAAMTEAYNKALETHFPKDEKNETAATMDNVKTIEGSTTVADETNKAANDASLINGTTGSTPNDASAKVSSNGGSTPNDATLKDVEEKAKDPKEPDADDKAAKEKDECMKDQADPVPHVEPPVAPQQELVTITASLKSDISKMFEDNKSAFVGQTDSLTKTLNDQTEKFNKLLEVVAKQGETILDLQNSQKSLSESVQKAMVMSSKETLEKLVDVASQVSASSKTTEVTNKSMRDFIDVFVGAPKGDK